MESVTEYTSRKSLISDEVHKKAQMANTIYD